MIRLAKIAAVTLSIALVISSSTALALPKNTGSGRIDEIGGELKDLQELKKKVEQRKNDLTAEVSGIDRKVDVVESKIADLDAQMAKVNEARTHTAIELSTVRKLLVKRVEEYELAQAKLDLQLSLIQERASAIYMNDSLASIALFATFLARAGGIDDLVMRFNLVNYVLRADMRLLNEAEQSREVAAIKRRGVEKKKEMVEDLMSRFEKQQLQLSGLKNVQASERDKVAREKDYKQRLLTAAERDRASYERREAELREESARIEAELARLGNTPSQVKGRLRWPVRGSLESGYGWRIHPIYHRKQFHRGIDIGAPPGTNIVAAAAGNVVYSGYWGSYGKTVMIDHGGRLATLYAHQQELLVSEGTRVAEGQVIGKVGSTGDSTGPHLHFEVRLGGETKDPMGYL